jgi:hypothetical protein
MKSLQNDVGTCGEHRPLVTQNWHKDVRGLSGDDLLYAISAIALGTAIGLSPIWAETTVVLAIIAIRKSS